MPTPAQTLSALSFLTPSVADSSTLSIDSSLFPYVINGDLNTTNLEVLVGSAQTLNAKPVVVGSNHQFSGSIAVDPSLGEVTVQARGRNYDATLSWLANSVAFPQSTRLSDPTGNVQRVVQAGTTGGSQPSWNLRAPAQITNVQLIGSVLTVTVPNSFSNGNLIYLDGLTGATFLNGTFVAVQTASGAQFTASVNHPDYPSAGDTGFAYSTTTDNSVIWANYGGIQISPTYKFTLLFFISSLALQISPPSGAKSYKQQTICRLEWVTPNFPGFIGVRVMLSSDPSGVTTPFTQFGDLVTQITRSANVVVAGTTTTQVVGNQTTITTLETTEMVNYSSVDVPVSSFPNGAFYAFFSTVIQDPNTEAVFESQQTGPVIGGFVNLKVVSPTDFLALQRKEDIAGRLIGQMTRLYPDLDLTPRSEARDLLIDPVALELSNMSVREWFSRCATSISAISQLDDANGDGFSDTFDSSPIKQQLARAYGLSPTDTQSLIDKQFDILGEQAGLTRGGATASVTTLTFYTFTKPTQAVTFPVGMVVSTVADAETPSLNFDTRSSAAITPATVDAFFNADKGWWAVQVAAECETTGSVGNVGAGTIRTAASNVPSGWNVVNEEGADFGIDDEINSAFASRISVRLVTGVDSGTRNGYLTAALQTPGVVSAKIVAAGDLEMVRDWDPIRQKHVFGTVDIYARGTSFSQQSEEVDFTYENTGDYGALTSYLTLILTDKNLLKFKINNFETLTSPLISGLEMLVSQPSGTNSFYFGTAKAQIDNLNGYITLNPSEGAYVYSGDANSLVRLPKVISGNPATNQTALQAIVGAAAGTYTFQLIARLQSPLSRVPALQPVLSVGSVTGPITGVVDPSLTKLVRSSDFYLDGLSNNAGDTVTISTAASIPQQKTFTLPAVTPSNATSLIVIDTLMDLPLDQNGVPQNVLAVRSPDASILYEFGVDYTTVPIDRYHTYGLQFRNWQASATWQLSPRPSYIVDPNGNIQVIIAVQGDQKSGTVAPTWQASLMAVTVDNNVTWQNIGKQIVISYNRFEVGERLNFAVETHALSGAVATPLNNAGFVHNTWLPESYDYTTTILNSPVAGPVDLTNPPSSSAPISIPGSQLVLDGAVFNADGSVNVAGSTGLVGALIPHDSRYIKVTFNNVVMQEGLDFTLKVDPVSGAASIARIISGHIPDGGLVTVSYFYTEAFTFNTEYPTFVEVLATTLAQTKHAAADVLVKSMLANPIDLSLTIVLDPTAAPDVMDARIRTVIGVVIDNAKTKFVQAALVQQIMAITGVQNVLLPLTRCAKSDASYDVGVIIPTGTTWIPLAKDPAFAGLSLPQNSFITSAPVLPDSTIPSGGEPDAFVGMLYEGQAFDRAFSTADFLNSTAPPAHLASTATPGRFYIVGSNDTLNGAAMPAGYAQKLIVTIPKDVPNPANLAFRVTYQVFSETGANDITLSSTEYFTPGRVTLDYVTGS